MKEDLLNKANKEDIKIMAHENNEIKKNVSKYASINEVKARIDIVNAQINKQLSQRPTMEIFRSTIAKYDDKINGCEKTNN